MKSSILLISVAFASAAFGQASEWGQCGGINWTGPTTCVSGTYCEEQNAWYYQCLPGTASTTAISTSTKATTLSTVTSKPASTTSSKKTSSTTSSKATTSSQPASTKWEYLISFGDSYSQTGFEITGTKATANNILGNPPFPGYTTTNGDNWIDFLLDKYNKTLVLSYNFAYGGATTDASLVTPFESTVLSLVDQTTEFSTYLVPPPTTAPWTASNSLFAVWIGVNDVGNAWSMSNWTTIAEAVVTRYFQEVQIMYNGGARNFLFLTVPPIQYTPLVVAEGSTTQAQEGAAVAHYNGLLTAAAASFESAHSGSTVYVYDTTTPFMTALNNPTAYGAPNPTCFNADGLSCLWWNNYHPGQAIHNLVAEGVAALTGI